MLHHRTDNISIKADEIGRRAADEVWEATRDWDLWSEKLIEVSRQAFLELSGAEPELSPIEVVPVEAPVVVPPNP